MATVFSTATLGLQVDAKQLHKELATSEKATQRALEGMSQSAEAFETRWGDMTRGIKDTKRIISGILISQGFYALSNALLGASAAALEFSRGMETAAVSLEYFVDSAAGTEDAAAKVKAYLREVNEFAARTPFNTDQVLSLSKYMQAVGVAMSQTQSVLEVITDTAAATGASNEQLQRITFALGQMITKGRIANEEIRQLANANVPIYDILKEELHLTGEQISNIGKYWIDANDAVVAILNGLNKRYDGAADRVAETLTGLTDTIIDDAKIIANEAFSDVYDKVVDTAASLRNTLDYMRELSINKGMPGLFNDMALQIDPTGAVGNQILATVGNIRNLAEAFHDLYVNAAPVLSVVGKSFSASINVGLIALTALAKTVDYVVVSLDKLGITSGKVGQAIASLYVAYKATKFVSLLGNALAATGMTAYKAAAGIAALLPASMQARSGIVMLTGGVAGLITYLMTAIGLFSALQSSFSGLSQANGATGFNENWEKAYADYEKRLAEYNKAIDAYREKYQDPYTNMSDGKSPVTKPEDKDDKDKGKGGKDKGPQEWVAAFDEVYDVPDEDDGTGDYQDAVLNDFTDLLDLLGQTFKFPQIGMDLPDMPKFELGDVFGDTAWDPDIAGKDFWKAMIPAAILGLVTGLGKVFAKQLAASKPDVDGIDRIASGGGPKIDPFMEADKIVKQLRSSEEVFTKHLKRFQETLEGLRLNSTSATSIGTVSEWGKLVAGVDVAKQQLKLLEGELDAINTLHAMQGAETITVKELAASARLLNELEREALGYQRAFLHKQLANADTTTAAFADFTKQLAAVDKRLMALNSGITTVDISGSNLHDVVDALDSQGRLIQETMEEAFTGPLMKSANGARIYNIQLLRKFDEAFKLWETLADNYLARLAAGSAAVDTYGTRLVGILAALRGDMRKNLDVLLAGAVATNAASDATHIAGTIQPGAMDAAHRDMLAKMDEAYSQLAAIAHELPSRMPAQVHADSVAHTRSELEVLIKNGFKSIDETLERAIAAGKSVAARYEKVQQIGVKEAAELSRSFVTNLAEETLTFRQLMASNKRELKLREKDYKSLEKVLANYEARIGSTPTHAEQERVKAIHEELRLQSLSIEELKEEIGIAADANVSSNVRLAELFDGKLVEYERLVDAIERTVPHFEAFDERLKTTSSTLSALVPPSVQDALASIGMSARDLYATGTKMLTLQGGLDDFSSSIGSLVVSVFEGAKGFEKLVDNTGLLTRSQVKAMAALGNAYEPLVRLTLSKEFKESVGEVSGTGHVNAKDIPLIIQNDAAIQLLDKTESIKTGMRQLEEVMSLDIKTTDGDIVKQLHENAYAQKNGLDVIHASMLKSVNRPSWYYQFAAQIAAVGNKNNQMVMSILDRDYQFTDTYLLERFEKLMTANNGRTDLIRQLDGRILSVDALKAFASIQGPATQALPIDQIAQHYTAQILQPLFTNAVSKEFDTKLLSQAITSFIVDYAGEAFKTADIAALAKSYFKYNELFTLLGTAGVQTEKLLQSYVYAVAAGTKTFMSMDFTPVIRAYKPFARGISQWFNNILGEGALDGLDWHGAFTDAPVVRQIDDLVRELNTALKVTGDPAKDLAHFSEEMSKIADGARALVRGEDVSDELITAFGRMAENTDKYASVLFKLADATDTLAAAPAMIEELPRAIRTVVNQIDRLNADIAMGQSVAAHTVSSISANYIKVVEALHIQADAQAIAIGERLERTTAYLNGLTNKEGVLTGGNAKPFTLPFGVADMNEQLGFFAKQLDEALKAGTLEVADDARKSIEQIIATIELPTAELETAAGAMRRFDTLLERLSFVDIEAPGLPFQTSHGTVQPNPIQIGAVNPEGVSRNWFVNNGELNAQVLEHMRGINKDFAEAFKDVTVEMLDAAKPLDEVMREVYEFTDAAHTPVSAYNGANIGGYDLPILNTYAPADLHFTNGPDVMRLLTNEVNKYISYGKDMKLVDAYKIFVGQLEDVAHLADNDIENTFKVFQALRDGTVARIAQKAATLTDLKPFEALYTAGQAIRGETPKVPTVQTIADLSPAGQDAATDFIARNLDSKYALIDSIDEKLKQFAKQYDSAPELASRIDIASDYERLLTQRNEIARQINEQAAMALPDTYKSVELLPADNKLAGEFIASSLDNKFKIISGLDDKLQQFAQQYGAASDALTRHDLAKDYKGLVELRNNLVQQANNITSQAVPMSAAIEQLPTDIRDFTKNLTTASVDTGKTLGNALEGVTTKILPEAARAAGADAENAARKFFDEMAQAQSEAAGAASSKVSRGVHRFTEKLSDAAKDIKRYLNLNFGNKLAKELPKTIEAASADLTAAFAEMKKAGQAADDYVKTFGTTSPKLTKAFAEAQAAYEGASSEFVRSLIMDAHNGMKLAKDLDVDTFGTLLSKKTELLAYYFDKTTGQMRLIGDTLYTDGEGLLKGLRKLADAGEFGPEASKALGDAFTALDEALKTGNGVHEAIFNLSSKIRSGLGDFAEGAVIYDKADDVYLAGRYASKQVQGAAEAIDSSLQSVGKKIMTGTVLGYGIFDAVDIAFTTIDQHIRDEANTKLAGAYVGGLLSDETAARLKAAGVDTGEVVAGSIYDGAAQAFGESVIVNGVANLLMAAATTAIAGIPGLIVGTIGAIAVSAGASGAMGHDDASMYYGNWSQALSGGKGMDTAAFEAALTASGKYTPEQVAQFVEEARLTDTQALIDSLSTNGKLTNEALGSIVEVVDKNYLYQGFKFATETPMDTARGRNNLEQTLYGTNDYGDGFFNYHWWDPAGRPKENLYSGEKGMLPVRMLAAMGGIDATTSLSSSGSAVYSTLALGVENAEADLAKIKELLGDDTLYLAPNTVEVDGKKYFEVLSHNTFDPNKGSIADQGYQPGAYGTVYGNGKVQYYGNDMPELEALIRSVYYGGAAGGEATTQIVDAIGNNAILRDSLTQLGFDSRIQDAMDNLPAFLEMMNAQQNTSITTTDLDANYGLGAAYVQRQLQIQDTYEANKLGELNALNAHATGNDDTLNGNTASLVMGGELGGLSSNFLTALEEVGLKLTEGSYSYSSELTGDATQNYVVVETIAETLKDSLRGVTVDMSNTDFSNLSVTAAEAEVLAQAGIQVNGDGTVSFMKARNEEVSGNERDISLNANHFSQDILDQMGSYNMSIDFTAGEIDFGSFEAVKQHMSSALFDMSDDINLQLSDSMRESLSVLGTVTEDGLLQITNQAVLSGNTSMSSVLDQMDWTGTSAVVKEQLYNIAAQIDAEGASVQDNIIEWAAGVVVPSPIKAEDLTDEIIAEFDLIGISFTEGANGLQMVISNTGEALRNGVTLIDTEKWNQLSTETKEALTALGVEWHESANNTMVDLRGVMDAGIGEIVSLYVDQPEVWNQLPDSVKQYLEQCNITAEDELIEIQRTMGTQLVEITDGFITSWESLEEPTREALDDLGITTSTGMLKIKTYVEGAEIPETVNEEALVPFEKLPPEIQAELRKTCDNVEGMRVDLGTAATTGFSQLKSVVSTVCGEVGTEANQMRDTIVQAVTDAMIRVQQLATLQESFGSTGGFLGIGAKGNKPGMTRYGKDGSVYVEEITAKGEHVQWWRIKDGRETVVDSKSVPARASGGPASGLTLAGELGKELAIFPDGSSKLVDAGLYDFPSNTLVVNAEDTSDIVKYAGSSPQVQKLATGNATVTVPEISADEEAVKAKATLDTLQESLQAILAALLPAAAETTTENPAVVLTEQLQPMLQEELYRANELIATAIDGSTKVVIEELMRSDKQLFEEQTRALQQAFNDKLASHQQALVDKLGAISGEITSALSSGFSSVTSAVSSMSSAVGSLGSRFDAGLGSIGSILDSVDRNTSATEKQLDLTKDYSAEAIHAAERGDWKAVEEALQNRDIKISITGNDYGKTTDQFRDEIYGGRGREITAHAMGGLVTDDQLVRVGEFGKHEAILPLEQPSVMASLGEAVGQFVGGVTAEQLQAILTECLFTTQEFMALAVDNAVKVLTEETANTSQHLEGTLEELKGATVSGLTAIKEAEASGSTSVKEAVSSAQSAITSALSSGFSSVTSAISSMGASLGSSMSSNLGGYFESIESAIKQGNSNTREQIDLTKDYSAEAIHAAERGDWKAVEEALQNREIKVSITGKDYGKTTDQFRDEIYGGKGKEITSHALGGMVTDDRLVRVGEFGKKEAILPLEQPSIMASLGDAIGQFVGGITAEQLQTILVESLFDLREFMALAVDNAVKVITEESANTSQHLERTVEEAKSGMIQVLGELKEGSAANITGLKEAMNSNHSALVSALSSGFSSVTSAVGSMGASIGSNLGSSIGDRLDSIENSIASGNKTAEKQIDLTKDWSAEAIHAADRGDWKAVEEALQNREIKVSIIGTDYGKSTDQFRDEIYGGKGKAVTAHASGGLVTGDQLVRVGEFGRHEAIVPLEQPGIMAKLGLALAGSMPATMMLTPEIIAGILHAELYIASEMQAVAIRDASGMLAEEIGRNANSIEIMGSTAIPSMSTQLSEKIGTSAGEINSQLGNITSTITGAISSAASSIASAVGSSMSSIGGGFSSALDSIRDEIKSSSGGSSGLSDADRKKYGGSAFDQAHFTDAQLKQAASLRDSASRGEISWADAHTAVENIRGGYGYSGGADGSKYNSTDKKKGSARGSLVTKDALYRAGELGLNEAIIPLEKPDIMKQVGATIASFVPVPSGLQAAAGMTNGGVTTPTPAYNPSMDMQGMVNAVTQSVLESVLPAMYENSSTTEERTPVYVGTLIADDRGLKQLERKLYVIRKAEEARRQ